MMDSRLIQFTLACKHYLRSSVDIGGLRAYGRRVGLAEPTKLNKGPLIDKIVAILSGESAPETRSKRGAPLKNDYVDPQIIKTIDSLRAEYLGITTGYFETKEEPPFKERYQEFLKKNKEEWQMVVKQSDEYELEDFREKYTQPIYRGQLQMVDGYAALLPLDCTRKKESVLIPTQLIQECHLMEGDVLSCTAVQGKQALIAQTIHTINDILIENFKRKSFETQDVGYPKTPLSFCSTIKQNSTSAKYVDWLLPINKGQRSLICAAPKAGKTALLYQLADAATTARTAPKVLVLLNAQSPEMINQFRKCFSSEDLLYSTYEDEPEKQVFIADYLLRRAKRYVESGIDTLLFVDSLNALAHAYNETKESEGGKTLPCGLESKTLQYIKRYFGSARTFEKGASLTICATLSVDTGNPADEVLGSELAAVANHQISLSGHLAAQRIYPAISLQQSTVGHVGLFQEIQPSRLYAPACTFVSQSGEKDLIKALEDSTSVGDFEAKIK